MTQSNLVKEATKAKYPFPVRVVMSTIPAALVMLPILWLSEYPPEEWPFVSGVFTLSVVVSGTLIGCAAFLMVKRVYGYACAVAAKLGIDPDEPRDPTSGSKRVSVIGTLVTMLLLGMASWGLALYALAFVMAQMAMAPIGTHFSLIALAVFATGAAGFAAINGGLLWFFYTVDRNPQSIRRFSRRFHNWMNITAEIGQRQRVSGVPVLTGNS